MIFYERPRVLVIFCPFSRHEIVIYQPCEIWPAMKSTMALYGTPYKWGWSGEV